MSTAATLSLPLATLRGALVPETAVPADRTVELTWTTGARVRRQDYWTGENWVEELAVTPDAIDLDRLQSGTAPLLESHRSWGLDGVIGVVEDAHVANGEGRARVRFSERPNADAIYKDVLSGIIRNVSVGYVTHEAEELDRKKGEPRVLRATRWEPLEVSLVAVGADPDARVRGADDAPRYPCEVWRTTMGADAKKRTRAQGGDPDDDENSNDLPADDDEGKKPDDVPPPVDKPPEKEPADRASAARGAERARIREIIRIVRRANLPDDVSDDLVDKGSTLDAARARVLDELAQRTAPVGGTVTVGESSGARFRQGLENVILHRLRPDKWKLDEHGRELNNCKLYELARRALEVAGHRTGHLSPLELAGMALGLTRPERVRGDGFLAVSDFPAAMLNIARATLADGYLGAPRTFPQWTRRTTLPDFRPMNRISLGMGPKLLLVPEHAEYQRGKQDVHVEPVQLQTWGRIIALTRQAIINDDLSAFNRIPQQFGYAAASMESDAVYGILTGNPLMSDGFALFSSQHKNLSPAATIDLNAMTAARLLMETQQSSDGQYLGITPMFLIVGPLMETAAYQFTSSTIVPTAPSGVIPQYFKSLIVVVDPRIKDSSWFLAANPAQIDTIEYAYLEGAPDGGPMLESKDGWEIDGTEFKAREDFASAAVEWRGLVKTASTTLFEEPTGEKVHADEHLNKRK